MYFFIALTRILTFDLIKILIDYIDINLIHLLYAFYYLNLIMYYINIFNFVYVLIYKQNFLHHSSSLSSNIFHSVSLKI